MNIKFLYGSETGTAEILAMDMADEIDNHTTDVENVDDVDNTIFNSDDLPEDHGFPWLENLKQNL